MLSNKNGKRLGFSRFRCFGAGNEIRTRDPNLGKVVLYNWAIPAWVGVLYADETTSQSLFHFFLKYFLFVLYRLVRS